MATSDIDRFVEIDYELMLFRGLCDTESEYRNYLLIVEGGRITQHLSEFLFGICPTPFTNVGGIKFRMDIQRNKNIPKPIQNFITYTHREGIRTFCLQKDTKISDEVILYYLKAFNGALKWFENYYYEKFDIVNMKFEEIKETENFLDKKINKLENGEPWSETEPEQLLMLKEIVQGITNMNNNVIDMKKMVQEGNDVANDTNATVNDMNETVNDIDDTVHDINNKMDQLIIQLKEIHEEYKKDQQETEKKLDNDISDAKTDEIMGKFTDRCINRITGCIKKSFGNYKFEEEENELIVSLGNKNWNKLENQSKKFLITSKITYKSLIKLDENLMDYSGVCLLVTKALEVELTKRFCKWFLKELKGKDYSEYPPSLLDSHNGHQHKLSPKHFTLGTAVHLFGFIQDSQKNNMSQKKLAEYEKNLSISVEYSKKRLFNNFSDDDEEIRKTLIEYGSYVDKIRLDYRNPAAHTGLLNQTRANECFEYILEVQKVLKIMLESFDE